MTFFNTITQISIGTCTENPVFGTCTRIHLEDDCNGMYLVFEQDELDSTPQQIRLGFDEWDNICQAVLTLKNQPLVK